MLITEFFHLRFVPFEEVTQLKGKLSVSRYVEREKINLLSKRPLGAWTVWLANYKSFRSHGVDETSFTEELFSDLNDALNQYLLQGYRQVLSPDRDVKFVFVNNNGAGFESSSFSKYLSSVLFRLTGCKPTSNILRSSFVVNLLQSPEGKDASVRASAARLMRHSEREQAQTYDRRNQSDIKRAAQSFIGKRREREEEQDEVRVISMRKPIRANFSRGDLVVIPFLDSTSLVPSFWFAKVMADDGSEVTVMELQPNNDMGFRANLQCVWKEPSTAVFHVDAELNRETGLYFLLSTKNEILSLIKN